MAEKTQGRYAVMRDFVDIKSKLRLHVLMLALRIVHDRPIFCGKFGKLDGHGTISRHGVSHRVADIVRQGTHCERELIGVFRVAEKADYKIAGSHVMGEVGERCVAKRIVTDVLDHASAVGIGMGLIELRGREIRIAAEKQGNNGISPGEVNELFMRQKGVGGSLPAATGNHQQRDTCGLSE